MTIYEQDKELVNDILKRNYYESFKKHKGRKFEIFLAGSCQANCKYCYLKQHKKDLYPNEIDKYDKIINNFKLLIDWYVENKFCTIIDIFSGQWLDTPLREPIMQIMYDAFKDKSPAYKPIAICMADNMQFLKDESVAAAVQKWILKFRDIDIMLSLSCSIDGKYCEQDRTLCDDDYYKKLFQFMEDNNLLAHPMVSSYNVKNWIVNYQWWANNAPDLIYKTLMMLEVRDETWNEESISDLIHFLDFEIDYLYEHYFKDDKEDFLRYVLKMRTERHKDFNDSSYINISLPNIPFDVNKDGITCSLDDALCIRAADLSVAPCHRQFYKELLIGHYNVINNKITDFEPENISLLVMKDHIKRSCLPHCENCNFIGVCIGFCHGNSYERYRNPLVPVKQVCDMLKAKYTYLIYKFDTMGLFEYMPNIQNEMRPEYRKYLEQLIFNTLREIKNDNL